MPDPRSTPHRRLGDLLSVTDTELRRLDLRELLTELLDRVREILGADTAVVLLSDASSQSLVATAARGLEEEVHQGVRIPIGYGFAGRIATTRRPVIIDRVDQTTVINPILWEKGIRTMLGVPLLANSDRLIGVLHVGRLEAKPFLDEEISLIEIVAERVAGAIESNQFAAERSAARILERSLMPTVLPAVPGLRLAARYVPAERGVGGDWYDAFVLPSGMFWAVTGDVAGHGLPAAVVMGRVRSTLRAYALLEGPPERTLELTDRKIMQFEVNAMVTVSCAVANPPYQRFRLSSAGHPPPVLAEPGGRASFADVAPDPPLGAATDKKRHSHDIELSAGRVLLMYTDGLVERPGESIAQGLDRLREATIAGDPEFVCRSIMHELVGSNIPDDDIAVMAIERAPPPRRESSARG